MVYYAPHSFKVDNKAFRLIRTWKKLLLLNLKPLWKALLKQKKSRLNLILTYTKTPGITDKRKMYILESGYIHNWCSKLYEDKREKGELHF